jgi:hypothetical protein
VSGKAAKGPDGRAIPAQSQGLRAKECRRITGSAQLVSGHRSLQLSSYLNRVELHDSPRLLLNIFFKHEDGHRCDLGADMVGNHTENMLHEKAGVQGYLDNGNAFTRESTSWLTNHQLHEKTACVRELW